MWIRGLGRILYSVPTPSARWLPSTSYSVLGGQWGLELGNGPCPGGGTGVTQSPLAPCPSLHSTTAQQGSPYFPLSEKAVHTRETTAPHAGEGSEKGSIQSTRIRQSPGHGRKDLLAETHARRRLWEARAGQGDELSPKEGGGYLAWAPREGS